MSEENRLVNFVGISKGVLNEAKKAINPHYECDTCKCRLDEGDFMAVIGKTPPAGLSMLSGRTDAILKKVGRICCERCFRNLRK